MPDTLTLSTSLSLGLLASIVSGVCYLVANGMSWSRPEIGDSKGCARVSGEGDCGRCGGDLRGGPDPCICPKNLFEQDPWVQRRLRQALSLMPWNLSTDRLELIEEESEGSEAAVAGDLRNVRHFLESLASRLAGGPLEATSVAPLYRHEAYLPSRSHALSPSAASLDSGASGAHAQLKRLVSRVVEEAAALPSLARYVAEPPHMPSLESSTYEDLLATAILNKVIERYQTENGSGGRSSGIHSASASPSPSERSSPRSRSSRHLRELTPPLREQDDVSDWEDGEVADEAAGAPRRVPFPEFGGDIIHSTDNEDRDFDEVSSSDIQAVDGSWEENWLFQKKKIKTIQSVPVPMLVPNSNTEYRALIGDRDAEDTTDLSDNASDTESDAEYKSNIKKVLDSKHVIGGKTKIDEILEYEPDSLTFVDGSDDFVKMNATEYLEGRDVVDAVNDKLDVSTKQTDNDFNEKNNSVLVLGVNSGPLPKAEFSLKQEIHRTYGNNNVKEDVIDSKTNVDKESDAILNGFINNNSVNTLSRHEKEGEYEETVTLPVQRYADSLRRKHFEDEPQEIPTRDTDIDDSLIPGTVAYRERKKWLNYVEMPNNPYSPEAIQKRLSSKSTSSLFDSLTAKSKDLGSDILDSPKEIKPSDAIQQSQPQIENGDEKSNGSITAQPPLTNGKLDVNGDRSKSPSPRILKEVLAEEIPQYKRFGRDYYIKEAKSATGGRKAFSDTSSVSSMNKSISLDNIDSDLASPGLLIQQFNVIAKNQQYTTFAGKNDEQESITTKPKSTSVVMIEYEDDNSKSLFSAQPAFVDEETDQRFEEILNSVHNPDTQISEEQELQVASPDYGTRSFETSYSSSLDDSIKIYNVPTGEIVKSKQLDNVSLINESTPDKNDNIDMNDKNIPRETETVSQNAEVLEDAVIIVDAPEDGDVKVEDNDRLDQISEAEEVFTHLPKVKELAKKFVSMENVNEPVKVQQPVRRRKSKENILSMDTQPKSYMHSLTARSISRQFREELKQSMATPLTVPGGSKEIPEGIEEVTKESSRPGSPLPEPGTLKTKLAFFESLKNKFNNK